MAQNRKILKTGLSVLGIVIVVSVIAIGWRLTQPDHDGNSPIVVQKHQQLQALDELAQSHEEFAQAYNEQVREPSLRDSGRRGVGLFIKNSFFRIVDDIGFDAPELSALLIARSPPRPVTLDDPSSFVIKPLDGRIIMPPNALSALFNRYLVDYEDTQLRNIEVTTRQDTLIVDGETQKIPGTWLPFHMVGTVRIVDGHIFVYEPDTIEIADIGAQGLLDAINLELSNLLEIETGGAEIQGNAVVLDLNHALPPPTQNMQVANMSVDEQGLHLEFTSEHEPAFPTPIVASDSYIMLQSGDVKTFRTVLTDVRLQMVAQSGGKLDVSLYGYRDQILNGLFDATPAGELVAYLAAYRPTSTNDAQAANATR